jgi:hypothetical protein
MPSTHCGDRRRRLDGDSGTTPGLRLGGVLFDPAKGGPMPNFNRSAHQAADDLEIATRVMDTVQRQVASYRDALQTMRSLRREIEKRQGQDYAKQRTRTIGNAEEFAALLEEHGIPLALSKAMAAEDFQDASFQVDAALWTWDCCCTDCCWTCDMGSVVTGCEPPTFHW